MKKSISILAVFFLVFTLSCSSTNWVKEDDPSYPTQMSKMLGRGSANVFCAPLELINQPLTHATGDSFGEWIGGLVDGVFRGIVVGTGRGISGVLDLGTFYFPHRALIDPEFIDLAEYHTKSDLAREK